MISMRHLEGDIADFDFFDRLRSKIGYIPRTGATEIALDTKSGNLETFTLRHFTSLNSFTRRKGELRQSTVDAAGAAILALHHFNNGIADVVPQVRDANSCGIKFTMDHMDTQLSPIKASRALIGDIFRRESIGDPQRPFPTALIGASRSAVSEPLAILTGINSLPQISYSSTSTSFDNKDQFPLFGRLVPSAIGDANAAVLYLNNILHVTHIGVLFIKDAYGTTYAQAIQDCASKLNPPMHADLFSFTFEAEEEDIADAISQLKASNLRYFFGIIFDTQYKKVMAEAHRQGIAGPGFFWLFGDAVMSVRGERFHSKDEAGLVEATNGAAVIATEFPSSRWGRPEFDTFMRYWKTLSTPEVKQYFGSKMPEGVIAPLTADLIKASSNLSEVTKQSSAEIMIGTACTENKITSGQLHLNHTHTKAMNSTEESKDESMDKNFEFSDVPGPFALLNYDTVIALAFAACDVAQNNKTFDGKTFYESFLSTSFQGPYGKVTIDKETGSRCYSTMPYSISNFIANPADENGMVSFQLQTTDVYKESKDNLDILEWKKLKAFMFAGGASEQPNVFPLQEIIIDNISTGVRIFGLTLCGISLLLSIGFTIWTLIHRNNEIVKASQPIFLGMLCFGSLLLGLSIIPLSLQDPIQQEILDAACASTPWLVSFGFIVAFSALFSKTMRVSYVSHGIFLSLISSTLFLLWANIDINFILRRKSYSAHYILYS